MNAGKRLLIAVGESKETINGKTLVQVLVDDAKANRFGISTESRSWGVDRDKL